MEAKKSEQDLETKLQNLKNSFLLNLEGTKLVLEPEVNGLSLTYVQRRGSQIQEQCRIIKLGLKAMLNRYYQENADILFDTLDNEKRVYRATLIVAANSRQEEHQLAYDVFTKINEFIRSYNQNHSKKCSF